MNEFGMMEESVIKIIIFEANSLPPMNVYGSADSFVIIKVNDEEVF